MADKLRHVLAENTAALRVLADRYVSLMAECQEQIDKEREQPSPSQYKIEALTHIRDRAEENLAKFKAGPDRLPDWMPAR